MSQIEPKLQRLLTINSDSPRKNEIADSSIERACEEIQSASQDVQWKVANYVVFYGNCSLVQLLLQRGFDPFLFLYASARKGNYELFEVVLESFSKKTSARPTCEMIHHPVISARIAQDPLFVTRLLDLLVPASSRISRQAQALDGFPMNPSYDGFLQSLLIYSMLRLNNSSDLPEYIRLVIQGCTAIYEQAQCRF